MAHKQKIRHKSERVGAYAKTKDKPSKIIHKCSAVTSHENTYGKQEQSAGSAIITNGQHGKAQRRRTAIERINLRDGGGIEHSRTFYNARLRSARAGDETAKDKIRSAMALIFKNIIIWSYVNVLHNIEFIQYIYFIKQVHSIKYVVRINELILPQHY